MRSRGFIIVIAIMIFLVMDIVVFAEEDGGYYYEDDTFSGSDDSGFENDNLGSDSHFDSSVNDTEQGFDSDISGSSSEMGQFGNDDTTVSDMLKDLLEGLKDTGLGLSEDSEQDVLKEGDELIDGNYDIVLFDAVNQLTSDFPVLVADGIDLYSNYNTYYGTIGSTYLEYARGYLPKLRRDEHYVLARTGQYDYIFAFGKELKFNGNSFSGTNITVIDWNTYGNGSFSYRNESSFSLTCGSNMVYTDLDQVYPSLAGTTDITSRQILYLLTIASLVWTVSVMYNVRSVRRLKKIENI